MERIAGRKKGGGSNENKKKQNKNKANGKQFPEIEPQFSDERSHIPDKQMPGQEGGRKEDNGNNKKKNQNKRGMVNNRMIPQIPEVVPQMPDERSQISDEVPQMPGISEEEDVVVAFPGCVGKKGEECKVIVEELAPDCNAYIVPSRAISVTNYDFHRVKIYVGRGGIVRRAPKRG